MRLARTLAALALAASLLGACGGDDDDTTNNAAKPTTTAAPDASTETTVADDGAYESTADHVFTAADDQSEVSVAAGETFDIVLETCPSCGYHWELVKGAEPISLTEEDNVTLTSEETVERPHEEGLVGGNADYVAHFKANRPGGLSIELGYIPPGATEAEESVIISVNVTE